MSQGQKELWVKVGQAAYLAGFSTQQFRQVIRPLIPENGSRKDGTADEFDARQVVLAVIAYQGKRLGGTLVGDADPLLAGGDSPYLERYRKIKGDLAELDYQERQKTHIDIRVLEAVIVRFASLLRRAGEILQRRWGVEALAVFNEALDAAERTILAELRGRAGDPKDNGDGESSSAPVNP